MTTNLLADWPLDATTVTRHDLEVQVAKQQRIIERAAGNIAVEMSNLQAKIGMHKKTLARFRDDDTSIARQRIKGQLHSKILAYEEAINILRDQLEILTGSRFPEEE